MEMATVMIGGCYGNCCSDTLNIGYCGQYSLLTYNCVSSYLGGASNFVPSLCNWTN